MGKGGILAGKSEQECDYGKQSQKREVKGNIELFGCFFVILTQKSYHKKDGTLSKACRR